MIFPKKINAYCPHCNKHTLHKVRTPSRGSARSLAFGTRKHERKLRGHGGKRAGEKSVKKMGKRQRVLLECSVCKKKQVRVLGSRTRKKLEFSR